MLLRCCALALAASFPLILGCGGGDDPQPEVTNNKSNDTESNPTDESKSSGNPATPGIGMPTAPMGAGIGGPGSPTVDPYAPIKLGSDPEDSEPKDSNPNPIDTERDRIADANLIEEKLRQFQLWVGQWEGIRQNGSEYEQGSWVWDYETDELRPALQMQVPNGEYYQTLRLTYRPEKSDYELTRIDGDEVFRYGSQWEEPIHTEPGDNDKPQTIFKLRFTEESPESEGSSILISQRNNHLYRVELDEVKPSGRVKRLATISTKRKGFSIAKAPDDYGERECIISQGLGTMTVSHNGQTFYVCCTGCKAAFEADPEKWIAKAEERKKAKMTP